MGNPNDSPLFVDFASTNLRLQSNSPRINAGSNASAAAGPDLDGYPRKAGDRVDMGAYGFPSPRSLPSYAWLQQYGLPAGGTTTCTDINAFGVGSWFCCPEVSIP